MLTAMVSLLTGIPVDPSIAMTGEATLRGAVLPVGGVKEKVLAAHRAGITTVILPAKNEKDLVEVPEEIQNELTFFFASRMEQVLDVVLGGEKLKAKAAELAAAKAAEEAEKAAKNNDEKPSA
jgi:ATP-dependent Lon protease